MIYTYISKPLALVAHARQQAFSIKQSVATPIFPSKLTQQNRTFKPRFRECTIIDVICKIPSEMAKKITKYY